jgi:hypothetical protein
MNQSKFDIAASMANLLNKSTSLLQTFPHRIYGEVLLKNHQQLSGLTSLKISKLLGDWDTKFNIKDYEYPTIGVDFTDNAHLYLGTKLGLLYDKYPIDKRPQGKID